MPLVELAVLWLAQSNARGIDFSIPTNKLSKKICRDLGKYSTIFPDDSNPSGEG